MYCGMTVKRMGMLGVGGEEDEGTDCEDEGTDCEDEGSDQDW